MKNGECSIFARANKKKNVCESIEEFNGNGIVCNRIELMRTTVEKVKGGNLYEK